MTSNLGRRPVSVATNKPATFNAGKDSKVQIGRGVRAIPGQEATTEGPAQRLKDTNTSFPRAHAERIAIKLDATCCPVCRGGKHRRDLTCPACQGEGYLDAITQKHRRTREEGTMEPSFSNSRALDCFFETLKRLGRQIHLRKNHVIFSHGDPSTSLFYVQEGHAKLT